MSWKQRINLPEVVLALLCLLVILFFPPTGIVVSFVVVLIYLLFGKNRMQKFRSIGFQTPSNMGSAILICLFLGILIEVTSEVFINPLIELGTKSSINLSDFDNVRGNIPHYLIWILLGWVIGGFLEEILFRGFLITRLSSVFAKEWVGNILAILITSATFGFSHMYQGWSGVISTGLIAIILGLIFVKSKKILWYSILTHGFINTTAFTLIYLDFDKVLATLVF